MQEGEEGLDDLDGLDPMLTDPGVDDPNAEGDLDQEFSSGYIHMKPPLSL